MLSSFAILLIVIAGGVLLGCLIWVIHLNLRARRLGLPSPPLIAYFRPPSSNPVYQSTGPRSNRHKLSSQNPNGGNGNNGKFLGIFGKKKANSRGEFGPLGEDEGAWDSRGYGGYYEEDAEMGLRVDTNTSRHNNNNNNNNGNNASGGRGGRWDEEDDSPPRGRSRSRSPRPGYNIAANRGPASGAAKGNNPFGDENKVRRSTDTGRSSVFTEETF
ncbi:hypothetical protein TWF225_007212 [Orbilia oligospora]|nr:hypothetical protein TWF225_007212 [Orbilia oligospora]KAF3254169.1 hypothetical protein TWF128_006292 [Orbilia oligospora]KAF3272004.1 hypothetical protein TWF217_003824 [Orbilia oligospora]KAF3274090.1 hypothetical protein TWF132_003958 [Orbilia oligospora]